MPALVGTCWEDGVWTADSWAADTWAAADAAPASSGIGARTSRYVQSRGNRVYKSWYAVLGFLLLQP
jgi:hypothetical protein